MMDGVRIERYNATLVVTMEKEVDHHLAKTVRMEVDPMIDRGMIKNLIFDFTGVSFMDSSGIGMLMGRYKKLQYFGGKIAVSGIQDSVERIFSMSGLYRLVTKYPTVIAALESLTR